MNNETYLEIRNDVIKAIKKNKEITENKLDEIIDSYLYKGTEEFEDVKEELIDEFYESIIDEEEEEETDWRKEKAFLLRGYYQSVL